MTRIRNPWILAALALLIACDPYTKENKGPLEIVSAFAVAGVPDDAGTGSWQGTPGPSANTYTIEDVVDPGATVFFVKTNKLLDGAKIQQSDVSCAPAAEVALKVNNVAASSADGWFTCYVPSTSIATEGASVVIYHGADIDSATPYFETADLAEGFYTIVANITDKQGNIQTVTITSGSFAVTIDGGTPTTTTIDLTFDLGGAPAAGVTTFDVQRAPDVTGSPGTWATIAADVPVATTTHSDTGLTAGTTYWYRLVLKGGSQVLTSTPVAVTTATPPA